MELPPKMKAFQMTLRTEIAIYYIIFFSIDAVMTDYILVPAYN